MNYTSQKLNFQSYTNGVSPHIGRAADGEREGYWYIGTHCTDVKAEGANARVILLDNDFDIIAINPLGEVVGTLPTVTAMVCEGDDPVLGQTITLSLPTNPTWTPGEHFYYYGNADESGQIISYTLKILKLPTGFTSGAFTFKNGVITKKFNLSTITSEKDYNIVIDRTLINSTLDGGTVYITVNEIDSTGTKTYYKNIQGKLELEGVTSGSGESWAVQYTKGQTTPVELTLKVKTEGYDDLITWDKEVIEFVADGAPGAPGVSYWIMRDTPVIARAADGSYITTSVTFTPMMQVGNDTPRMCTSDDNVAMKIWPDDKNKRIFTGAATIDLNKVSVENALHCEMYLEETVIDEETVEVLKDGVTVSKVEYAVLNQAGGDPPDGTNWVDKIPENIEKSKYLWTKTTYSNNMVAYTSSYQSSDGTHGDDSELVYAYYITSSKTINIPSKPSGKLDTSHPLNQWCCIEDYKGEVDSSYPYSYICEGTKKTTYSETGAGEVTYTWSDPKLYQAYNDFGLSSKNYASFLTATNFGASDALYWAKDGTNNAKLYIDASFIKTGALSIKSGSTEIFNANAKNGTVNIGKFSINAYGLVGSYNENYIGLRVAGIDSQRAIFSGATNNAGANAKFYVTNAGHLYAEKANIIGTITATEGAIGDFSISDGSLVYDKLSGSRKIEGLSISTSGFSLYNSSGKINISTSNITSIESIVVMPNSNYAERKITLDYNGLLLNFSDYQSNGNYDRHFIVGYDGKTYIKYTAVFTSGNKWSSTRAELIGTWYYGTSGAAYASARCVKNNITQFDNRHDILFDNLQPKTFSYKSGESGRIHYGYILDELYDAMNAAGITSEECGAYCLYDKDKPNGEGGIRYDEFVSLNTWQIQKLKPRMSAAEEKIKLLEEKIQSLENEIESLKNI